jgi:hypothetical protein
MIESLFHNLFLFLSSIGEVAKILAAFIAIYAFLLRFVPWFRKVDFYTTEFERDRYKGTQLFVVLENKSLVSLALKRVYLIIGDTKYLLIQEFNNPFILKPFETAKIGTGYIHSIVDPMGNLVDPLNFPSKKGLLLELYTNAKYNKIWTKAKEIKKGISYMSIQHASFNGVPYDISVIYAIQYHLFDKNYLSFVDKFGLCSNSIGKYHQLPKEHLITANALEKYLDSMSENWFGTKVKFFVTPLNEPLEKLQEAKHVIT